MERAGLTARSHVLIAFLLASLFLPAAADRFCVPLAALIIVPNSLGYVGDARVPEERRGWDWELLRNNRLIIIFCLVPHARPRPAAYRRRHRSASPHPRCSCRRRDSGLSSAEGPHPLNELSASHPPSARALESSSERSATPRRFAAGAQRDTRRQRWSGSARGGTGCMSAAAACLVR